MEPGEFTYDNAVDLLPDERRRVLGEDARQAANRGAPREPPLSSGDGHSYWDRVLLELERIVWLDAYDKRSARLVRLADRTK